MKIFMAFVAAVPGVCAGWILAGCLLEFITLRSLAMACALAIIALQLGKHPR